MGLFQTNQQEFNQATWEQNQDNAEPELESAFESTRQTDLDPNQFILFQLSDDPQKRILNTSEVEPLLKGSDTMPDVNLQVDFDAFKFSDSEGIDPDTKATLQLVIGQGESLSGYDKFFYCINGGLELYDKIKGKKSSANDFKKSTGDALGKKAISMPRGLGQISLKVVKHQEPAWWQRVFSFASTSQGKELLSLVGFGGITEAAVNTIGGMMENLFSKEPEILFESAPIKLAFSGLGKTDLNGGLLTNHVSSLNAGYWVMARMSDYQKILSLKPIYYNGPGLLAEDQMDLITAMSHENTFNSLTYAIMRVKMKEVDLKQNLF